jgi:hypothetical protein
MIDVGSTPTGDFWPLPPRVRALRDEMRAASARQSPDLTAGHQFHHGQRRHRRTCRSSTSTTGASPPRHNRTKACATACREVADHRPRREPAGSA